MLGLRFLTRLVHRSLSCHAALSDDVHHTSLLQLLPSFSGFISCMENKTKRSDRAAGLVLLRKENLRNYFYQIRGRAPHFCIKKNQQGSSQLAWQIVFCQFFCFPDSVILILFSKWAQTGHHLCFQSYFVKCFLEHEFSRKYNILCINIYLYIFHTFCLDYIEIFQYEYSFNF